MCRSDNDFDDDEDQHLCVGEVDHEDNGDEVDDNDSDDGDVDVDVDVDDNDDDYNEDDVDHLFVGEAAHLPILAILHHVAHWLAPGHHWHVLDHRYDAACNHKYD